MQNDKTQTTKRWRNIKTAPRNGTLIWIRGFRFMTKSRYEVKALWTTRKCPTPTTGWFPQKNDDKGDYINPTQWRPL